MTKLVLNDFSKKQILSIAKNLPQSLLITGDKGIGLEEAARYIATLSEVKPLIVLPEKDEKIDLIKGVISVDIMRRLYDETRTKQNNKQIIVINYADRMTVQAQNAFLKLLEEPNGNVYFILLSSSTNSLLPTILSRVEKITLRQITHDQSVQLLDELSVTDKTKRAQMLFIADGLPEELQRLSGDEKYFESRTSSIRDAREFLKGNVYQKLVIAQKYKDSQIGSLVLLNDMLNILKRTVKDSPKPETLQLIDDIINTYERIGSNGNIRLALTQLAI